MEKLVLNLCGLWFWLTRKSRTNRYSEVANSLTSARLYLFSDYTSRASTRDRGRLLPHHIEALTILERHIAFTYNTAHRFDTLDECCKFVTEELTQPPKAA
jgi:hypothetical protein